MKKESEEGSEGTSRYEPGNTGASPRRRRPNSWTKTTPLRAQPPTIHSRTRRSSGTRAEVDDSDADDPLGRQRHRGLVAWGGKSESA